MFRKRSDESDVHGHVAVGALSGVQRSVDGGDRVIEHQQQAQQKERGEKIPERTIHAGVRF